MPKQAHAPSFIALAGLLTTGSAQAHPGHDSLSLVQGLLHPLAGFDHLLAMVAVGLWSAAALPAGRRLAGPAVFLALLLVGAALPVLGLRLGTQAVEMGVALSVAALGALMLASTRAGSPVRRLPAPAGLWLVAAAGLLHGLAHGMELGSGQPFAGYAVGFMAASAMLHAAGWGLGSWVHTGRRWAWRAVAAGMSVSGLALLASRL